MQTDEWTKCWIDVCVCMDNKGKAEVMVFGIVARSVVMRCVIWKCQRISGYASAVHSLQYRHSRTSDDCGIMNEYVSSGSTSSDQTPGLDNMN